MARVFKNKIELYGCMYLASLQADSPPSTPDGYIIIYNTLYLGIEKEIVFHDHDRRKILLNFVQKVIEIYP